MSDRKYPLSITPLFKSGYRQQSLGVTPEIMEALSQVQLGGKLIVRTVKEESRKSEKSPVAYLEYLTPEEVEENRRAYEQRKSGEI